MTGEMSSEPTADGSIAGDQPPVVESAEVNPASSGRTPRAAPATPGSAGPASSGPIPTAPASTVSVSSAGSAEPTGSTVLIANPSADVYGSDLQMLESARALRLGGHRVIVTTPTAGPLVERLAAVGVPVQQLSFPVLRRSASSPLGILRLGWSALTAMPRMIGLLRRLRPAVLYVNTLTLPWWLLAGRLSGVPTICHLHEAENKDSKLVRMALNQPVRLATIPLANGTTARDALAEVVPSLQERVTVVHNGVELPPERPEPAAHRPGEPYRLVVVGRLSPRKLTDLALEAVAQLRTRGRDITLEVVGSPAPGQEWFEDELRARAAQPDLAGAVSFTGYANPVWPAFARADFAVSPSARESFGNSVVEAQLARRPVVAAGSMGHLEIVEHEKTGLLAEPEDARELAAGIERLVDDPELASRLAAQAEQSARQRFSVTRYAEQINEVVDVAAASRRPSRWRRWGSALRTRRH